MEEKTVYSALANFLRDIFLIHCHFKHSFSFLFSNWLLAGRHIGLIEFTTSFLSIFRNTIWTFML